MRFAQRAAAQHSIEKLPKLGNFVVVTKVSELGTPPQDQNRKTTEWSSSATLH
jgi:hypothetical protein